MGLIGVWGGRREKLLDELMDLSFLRCRFSFVLGIGFRLSLSCKLLDLGTHSLLAT